MICWFDLLWSTSNSTSWQNLYFLTCTHILCVLKKLHHTVRIPSWRFLQWPATGHFLLHIILFLGNYCMWVYMLLACTSRLVHFLTVVIFKHILVFRLIGATENTMMTRMVFIWKQKQSIPCGSLALRYQSVLVQQYNA